MIFVLALQLTIRLLLDKYLATDEDFVVEFRACRFITMLWMVLRCAVKWPDVTSQVSSGRASFSFEIIGFKHSFVIQLKKKEAYLQTLSLFVGCFFFWLARYLFITMTWAWSHIWIEHALTQRYDDQCVLFQFWSLWWARRISTSGKWNSNVFSSIYSFVSLPFSSYDSSDFNTFHADR